MNQAALHSNMALARYDQKRQQVVDFDLDGDAEQRRPQTRSGRNISSQPYGTVSDTSIMDSESSRALIKIKGDASRPEDDYDESICGIRGDASFSHPTPPRSALVFPASAIGGPGIDAAGQIATMQAKLNQRLGPEFISTRQGPGGANRSSAFREKCLPTEDLFLAVTGTRLSYLEGWKAIELANEVFGFNGWSSSITRMDVDFLDEVEGRKWNVGVSVVMRITLRDGTFHEDIGYGHCENVKMKHQALEKARKEASTDALKRALRTFGRMLGNCLYDKKFVDTASRLKTAPTKYDLTTLKRNHEVPNDVVAQPQVPLAAASTSRASPVTPKTHQERLVPSQSTEIIDTNQTIAPGSSSDKITKVTPIVKHQQTNVDKPQSNTALSREERKAIAAAKQAAIRTKKEEERAKLDILTNRTLQSNSAATSIRGKKAIPTSQSMESEFGKQEYKNVDEYDLQLIEAGFDDEDQDDLLEEGIVEKPKTMNKRAATSSLEDGGNGLVDNFTPRQNSQNTTTALGVNLKSVSKGRFLDSSSPPQCNGRNDRSGLPSSSPRVPIVRGRRLSMIDGNTAVTSQAPSSSQSQRNRNNRQSVNHQGASSKRVGGTGDYNVSIKRPRSSPYQ